MRRFAYRYSDPEQYPHKYTANLANASINDTGANDTRTDHTGTEPDSGRNADPASR